ncbi:metallophosphoesterase [Streptomyces albipurpureus]|uniref:Metallophosphoesterase n=1 Tax=Streptomyces albipurpureus TaxID=2897419 RepID=A0ABT0UYF5_9ACTN|nr:metallophosphoesterase [Streptomyces sp. CWNU-1]MCM2393604.1 metallophosphoesterase [Streptomyces sp. CWNU-1]
MTSPISRDRAPADLLFTFAVIADSHVNPGDDHSSSPWASNRLANERSRRAVAELNRLSPDFVVHLGDLVHPVPALETFTTAATSFQEIYSGLACPLYLVPGNHDVGDKPGEWLPAKSVTEPFLEKYRSIFGRDYYSFDHGGCHFVVINAQLLNSGLVAEQQQRTWLEDDLQRSREQRTFAFTHYPAFITSPTEIGHYDNIDEPARSWLLDRFAEFRVEGAFGGHVHNFFYNRHRDSDHYVAPSVAFVRHDYSEFSRIAPEEGHEYGRNDTAKLGFFLVEVYPDRHVTRVVRDYLRHDDAQASAGGSDGRSLLVAAEQPSAVGVDARQLWTEETQIPYSGVVDEFARKTVRNDYPLMAMWEMGINRLRVPVQDLLDDRIRGRMEELAHSGHQFQVFTYGVPGNEAVSLLTECRWFVSSLEVILPPSQLTTRFTEISRISRTTGLPVHLSAVRTSANDEHGGDDYAHHVRHGFTLDDQAVLQELIATAGFGDAVSGLAFTVARSESPVHSLAAIDELVAGLGLRATVLVKLAADHPGSSEHDDRTTASRVAETLVAAHELHSLEINLDTFGDMDRGYFPRNGLVDRRSNLRSAGLVAKHLTAALPKRTGRASSLAQHRSDDLTWIDFGDGVVVIPEKTCSWDAVRSAVGTAVEPGTRVVDLVTGSAGTVEGAQGLCGGPVLVLRVSA